MSKKINVAIRAYMVNQILIFGTLTSEILVEDTKRAFPSASHKQIAGNLSATCCYFKTINYSNGFVS